MMMNPDSFQEAPSEAVGISDHFAAADKSQTKTTGSSTNSTNRPSSPDPKNMDQHTTKQTMPPPHDRDPSPIINSTVAGNNHHVLPAEHTSQSATTATTNVNVNGSNIHSNRRSDSIDSSTSTTSTSSNAPFKPHTGGNVRWDAINSVSAKESSIGLTHFRLLRQLGYGDFGSVYLVELKGTRTYYAMKVMDKSSLANWNKMIRAQTEREILGLLDHPFLPTLYSHFETDQFYCLVMEFCSGGNLHSLLQKQPNKRFTEEAARFYASEILLALEYLHMLGIVYRDLKPENVLVRDEGHIMLADFDLSLRCSVSPTLVKSSSINGSGGSSGGGSAGSGGGIGGLVGGGGGSGGGGGINTNSGNSRGAMLSSDELALQRGCMRAPSFLPRILPTTKKNRKSKSDFGLFVGGSMPELMAEPSNVRSMSFVGTHEYLAPEIILGEGHGSAVDWWTLGIFLYELLHGTTPFKGSGNRATLFNVVGQPLRFPDTPGVSLSARDLIRGLLVKEPHKRIAYRRGATEIKQHPFFEGVNWALVRSAMPPHIPDPVDFSRFASKNQNNNTNTNNNKPVPTPTPAQRATSDDAENTTSRNDSSDTDFEYF